jgi:hypothetical protein
MSTPAFCYFDSDLDDSEYEFKLHPVAFLNSDSDVESVDMNECIHGTRSRSCDPNDVDTLHVLGRTCTYNDMSITEDVQ